MLVGKCMTSKKSSDQQVMAINTFFIFPEIIWNYILYLLIIFIFTGTYERGREKLKLAENVSDLDTENEEISKKSRASRHAKRDRRNEVSSGEECSDEALLEQSKKKFSEFPDSAEFNGRTNYEPSCSTSNSGEMTVLATFEQPMFSTELVLPRSASEKFPVEKTLTSKNCSDTSHQEEIHETAKVLSKTNKFKKQQSLSDRGRFTLLIKIYMHTYKFLKC